MTQRQSSIKVLHRVHGGVTVAVILTLLVLNLFGTITNATLLTLFLKIEVPLILLLAFITVLRFRNFARPDGVSSGDFLDRLEAEEPLLRGAISELRAFANLFLVVTGRRRLPPSARGFGYTKGTMLVPVVVIVLTVVELVVVHLLVPWQWLRIVLLVLTIWALLFVLGLLASRVVHPHFVNDDVLNLRWGRDAVLTTSLANIIRAERYTHFAHTQPHVEDDRLILTALQPTNVRLSFAEPVAAVAPVSKKHRPPDFRASEARVFVDDPDAFLKALSRNQMEWEHGQEEGTSSDTK